MLHTKHFLRSSDKKKKNHFLYIYKLLSLKAFFSPLFYWKHIKSKFNFLTVCLTRLYKKLIVRVSYKRHLEQAKNVGHKKYILYNLLFVPLITSQLLSSFSDKSIPIYSVFLLLKLFSYLVFCTVLVCKTAHSIYFYIV